MLTRDLLLFRKHKESIRPSLLKPGDGKLQALAGDLIDLMGHAVSAETRRSELEEAMQIHADAHAKVKVGRGLCKLLFDRAEFEEPDGALADNRHALFVEAAAILRGELPPGITCEGYLDLLAHHTGQTRIELDRTREHLYDDLPGNRKLTGFRKLSPLALLHRYNLAQVQGLVLHADRLQIHIPSPKLLELRKVLRRLKFSRLVADLTRDTDDWYLTVEGPGKLLDMQKKYGLQLAQFVGAVPMLSRFTLTATVTLPRRSPLTLEITHKHKLVANDNTPLGHIPPEVAAVMESFEADGGAWQIDLTPEMRHVGIDGMCVADFSLHPRDPERDGPQLAIELFHRWHRHALGRRLEQLSTRVDPTLYIGVDRALLKRDDDLRTRVEAHPQTFVFNQFPSRRVLNKLLKRFS